ncbi:sodium/hydrogen exchanger 9B2 isoform X5 [Globicephala melas]|uniref:sodium/hydrogen exchanger 9B2 isoform X5 n=1 Tax=Globicephala melas TaxID=9731 RepID=UPI00293D23D7|nr:sodium/hydrogen exchanger 9B2 isoform X5 [Globicephala melas]
MENQDKTIKHEDSEPSSEVNHTASRCQVQQEETVMNPRGIDGNEPTEGSNLLNSNEKMQETPAEPNHLQRLRQTFACPPRGLLDRVITNVTMVVLLWAVVWSVTGPECLPGGNLFGIIILFYCAIIGGKLFGLIKLPTLPPLPPLLGPEEVEGCLYKIILGSLSCGGVCVCSSCPLPHGFTMAMGIYAGEGGYGVEKGVPTLLMAAGSFDDILAITGFNTCLGMAFSTGSTVFNVLKGVLEVVVGMAAGLLLGFFIQYFPSSDQDKLVWKRAFLVLGLSVLAVFSSMYFGFPGAGGLCTLVLAFLAGKGWASAKADVEKVIAVAWFIFQPLLFGLIGAEVAITALRPETVGLCIATLGIAVLIRILATYLMVCFAGFNFKEKIFISFAWLPKATVQAAIGSVALDTARSHGEKQLEGYGMDVLTVAFLAILITAPIGSLLIGLLGPRLLQKAEHQNKDEEDEGETSIQV